MSTQTTKRSELDAERAKRAGCLALRRARSTGTVVGLYKGAEADLDDDDGLPYATVCEDHAGIVCHATLTEARGWLSHPEEWCPRCQGDRNA